MFQLHFMLPCSYYNLSVEFYAASGCMPFVHFTFQMKSLISRRKNFTLFRLFEPLYNYFCKLLCAVKVCAVRSGGSQAFVYLTDIGLGCLISGFASNVAKEIKDT